MSQETALSIASKYNVLDAFTEMCELGFTPESALSEIIGDF